MFTSITTVCLKKYLAHQQYSVYVGKKLVTEYKKVLYTRCDFLYGANESFSDFGKCSFHTSSIKYGSKNLLKKFAKKSKKKQWYETPAFVPRQMSPSWQTGASPPTTPNKNQESSLRTRILNTILFKAISDLLNSHEISEEVYNLSVELSKVSLPADYSSCRVYWKTSGTSEGDSRIQQALDKSASRIRYLLISQQILGSVPPLVFIKDKQYAALTEVENLLKLVSLGQEEQGQGSNHNVDDQGESADVANSSGLPSTKKITPLFGIDHEALNKQVLEYKQRSREASLDIPPPSLTQQQLDMLAELRKQKLILKKRKSRQPVDNDITPKAYLLARYSQGHDSDEDEVSEYDNEESQVKELMAEEDRRS
ncbi:hypothetical protein MATL_G00132300 [Megalops atlanticus]|uniref:Ribosome-binding factor A, mitochondrial n=1 Tax=Megalops atlanticus TaxID=7932 RepID=A0A9D3PWP0_MEGAT|nr:hypothetical protein MATL_G00132300 [Megalops atlanticus]